MLLFSVVSVHGLRFTGCASFCSIKHVSIALLVVALGSYCRQEKIKSKLLENVHSIEIDLEKDGEREKVKNKFNGNVHCLCSPEVVHQLRFHRPAVVLNKLC